MMIFDEHFLKVNISNFRTLVAFTNLKTPIAFTKFEKEYASVLSHLIKFEFEKYYLLDRCHTLEEVKSSIMICKG